MTMTMTKIDTANAIAQDAGTQFVQSTSDASWATKRAIPMWQAADIERRLTEAGIEASIATDNDDRSIAWVYATLDEVAPMTDQTLTGDAAKFEITYGDDGETDTVDATLKSGELRPGTYAGTWRGDSVTFPDLPGVEFTTEIAVRGSTDATLVVAEGPLVRTPAVVR